MAARRFAASRAAAGSAVVQAGVLAGLTARRPYKLGTARPFRRFGLPGPHGPYGRRFLNLMSTPNVPFWSRKATIEMVRVTLYST